MTFLRNNFEGGTSGATIAAANSGGVSGDAFSAVSGSQLFTNVDKHEGTMAADVTAVGFLQWSMTAATQLAMRAYAKITVANAGANSDFFGAYLANGNPIATLRINASNQLRLYHGISTNFIWSPDRAIPVGSWVRVEMLIEQGTTAANGRIRAALYLNNSPTPLEDSGWITGFDLGGGSAMLIERTRWGAFASTAAGNKAYLDDVALTTNVDYVGFIGASTPELATPVVTVSAKVNPTTPTSADGSITVTWPAVAGAIRYESDLKDGSVTSGFVADDSNATSPKTYSGLKAGIHTVAVRAIAP